MIEKIPPKGVSFSDFKMCIRDRDKAIFDKIQHVLDGLVTDDLDLLQLT